MLKNCFSIVLVAAMLVLGLGGCKDDQEEFPSFGQITITPDKEIYHVGDVVICRISRISPGTGDLRKASYWWYTSWWFTESDMKADFQDFDDSQVCVSQEITLTKPGEVTLYFFGRLEYPHYDFRKIEIGRKINVVE